MKKLLPTALLSVFLLTFAFSSVFAQVTGPNEGCRVSAGKKAGGWETYKIGIAAIVPTPPIISPPTGSTNGYSTVEVTWLKKSSDALQSDTINAKAKDLLPDDKETKATHVVLASTPISVDTVQKAIDGGYMVASPDEFFMPQTAVSAQNNIGIKPGSDVPPNWAVFCLLGTIDSVINWIFTFLIVVSVALIVIAGFMWATAGSSPENQKKAGNMLKGAAIGIVIALLARVIPALVVGIIS